VEKKNFFQKGEENRTEKGKEIETPNLETPTQEEFYTKETR
jgi:hypothetical protein